MVWVRLEDGYPRNRKVAALSDAAFRLDVSAICWSNATGADGRILPHELTEIRAKATGRHAAELVARGRWHVAGTPCPHQDEETCPPSTPDGGGWVIHDIWAQQKPASVVEEERKAKAERQARWLAKKKGGETSRSPSRDASQDTSGDAQKDIAPSPPRPAPKGRAGTDVPAAPPAAGSGGAAAGVEAKKPPPSLPEPDDLARLNAEHDATTARGLAAARAALRRTA